MNLAQQIQVLINNAPQDGNTPQVVEAIAPVLKQLASGLQHYEYYILQSIERGWVMTTLSNRTQPETEKKVIYAFPTLKDAAAFQVMPSPELSALPVPVTHILFQLLAIEVVDSIVFFETPGNLDFGTEVRREDVKSVIQTQLQNYRAAPLPHPSNLPPDIA